MHRIDRLVDANLTLADQDRHQKTWSKKSRSSDRLHAANQSSDRETISL